MLPTSFDRMIFKGIQGIMLSDDETTDFEAIQMGPSGKCVHESLQIVCPHDALWCLE